MGAPLPQPDGRPHGMSPITTLRRRTCGVIRHFGPVRDEAGQATVEFAFAFPLQLFVMFAIIQLAMLYVAHRLGPVVRRLEGKCARCGYMLRGLPEPRCPECGTLFNPADLEKRRGRQESGPADRPEG